MPYSVEEQREFDDINRRILQLEYKTGIKAEPTPEELAAQAAAEAANQPPPPNVDTEARAGVQRVESKLDDILSFIKGASSPTTTIEESPS